MHLPGRLHHLNSLYFLAAYVKPDKAPLCKHLHSRTNCIFPRNPARIFPCAETFDILLHRPDAASSVLTNWVIGTAEVICYRKPLLIKVLPTLSIFPKCR